MKIYEPYKIRNVTFKSRIVMPPMVPFGVPGGQGHTLGSSILEYYRKRIHSELGLVITHSFSVTGEKDMMGGFGLYNENQRDDLSNLVNLCHQNDTRILAQIGYPSTGHHRHEKIEHLTTEKLKHIEDEYVYSALLAKQAGCDGVEIHGANMFFLNLFSSPITNNRTDEYGGDLTGRLRLAANIIKRIQEFADENFLISYRMGWNKDLTTDIETAKALECIGIDLLHVSYGIREADAVMPKEYPPVICYPGSSREKIIAPEEFSYNDVVFTSAQIHNHVNVPMVLVDEIWTLAKGEYLLEQHLGEFVAFGRPFLADENFLHIAREKPAMNVCYKCKECAWFDDWTRCPKQIKLYKERGAQLNRDFF